LTALTLGENIKSIASYAFLSSGIKEFTILSDTFENIDGYSFAMVNPSAFYGPLASADHRYLVSGTTLISFAGSGITNYAVPNGIIEIGVAAFRDKSTITAVTLPNSIETIGEAAFMNTKVVNMVIPDSVTSMGGSVFTSTDLSAITFGTGLTSIPSSAFSSTRLQTITIPDAITYIGTSCFKWCNYLTGITIGTGATNLGSDVFTGCTSLREITCKASTAPTIFPATFRGIRSNGTLKYPQGSDYSSWLASGNYYLGSYGWTGTPITS
jgi:hypothetical protein